MNEHTNTQALSEQELRGALRGIAMGMRTAQAAWSREAVANVMTGLYDLFLAAGRDEEAQWVADCLLDFQGDEGWSLNDLAFALDGIAGSTEWGEGAVIED